MNRKKNSETRLWILSVDPNYFDKPVKVEEEEEEIKEYEEENIKLHDNKITPN